MEISNQFIGWGLLIASGLLTLWRKKKSFDIPQLLETFIRKVDGWFLWFLGIGFTDWWFDIGGARFSRFVGWFSFIAGVRLYAISSYRYLIFYSKIIGSHLNLLV
jgi:hypothetical protein